mgnify:CR=1 FL=1
MAHKKGGGSTRNGRGSNAQYRGVKVYGGQAVRGGSILGRQVGLNINPGRNAGVGRDYTLFALVDGTVTYEHDGKTKRRVSVYPVREEQAGAAS